MSELPGIIPYDLAGNWCSECGQAKMNRLLEYPTSCTECTEVITRHRCTKRPPTLYPGHSWKCPDCDSIWTVDSETVACPDCCGNCGHTVSQKHWDYTPGGRIDNAPKHKPQPLAPFRNPWGKH